MYFLIGRVGGCDLLSYLVANLKASSYLILNPVQCCDLVAGGGLYLRVGGSETANFAILGGSFFDRGSFLGCLVV